MWVDQLPDYFEVFMNTRSIQTLARCIALSWVCGIAATAQAQLTAEALHTRATAAMCANCHGTEGRTIEGSSIPSLAGMPKDYMVLQMKALKEGTRPATVMHQLSKGLTDAQIQTIASYYAAIPR
jgi:cytochrome subunit of sulfide dehydrogenase